MLYYHSGDNYLFGTFLTVLTCLSVVYYIPMSSLLLPFSSLKTKCHLLNCKLVAFSVNFATLIARKMSCALTNDALRQPTPFWPNSSWHIHTHLLEKLVIWRGSVGGAAEAPQAMLQRLVIRVIGHHGATMEIGWEDKVEGADPLDHCLRLGLHLHRAQWSAASALPRGPSGGTVEVTWQRACQTEQKGRRHMGSLFVVFRRLCVVPGLNQDEQCKALALTSYTICLDPCFQVL